MTRSSDDLSVVRGGPLFRLLRKTLLSGDELELLPRRVLLACVLAWVPPFLLAIRDGTAWGSAVAIPFLRDVDVHTRLLVALPLLLAAETAAHLRLAEAIGHFLERRLVGDAGRPGFDAAVASARRLRDSTLVELSLVVVVAAVAFVWFMPQRAALGASGWYGTVVDGRLRPSWAGWWLGYVSLPLFQFLLVRWYLRLFIWGRLLFRVSRLELDLVPSHPDRAAGLGFLGAATVAFLPFVTAHGAMFSGSLANTILHTGKTLLDFKAEIAGLTAVVVLLVLGPLLVFVPMLARCKRIGLLEYGTLAQRYVRAFDARWLRGGEPDDSGLLGTGDIQSLADLSGSYEVVQSMRWIPFAPMLVVGVVVATILPMLPLLLTMMPLEELVKQLVRIFLGRG